MTHYSVIVVHLYPDFANAEHEADGEEAAADPAKKSRIEQLLREQLSWR